MYNETFCIALLIKLVLQLKQKQSITKTIVFPIFLKLILKMKPWANFVLPLHGKYVFRFFVLQDNAETEFELTVQLSN